MELPNPEAAIFVTSVYTERVDFEEGA